MNDSKSDTLPSLIGGRTLAKSAIWNLVGLGAPAVAAIFCIPQLINGLGVDRFGILTLAWMVIGYFSLFDFGIGRALTQIIAEKLGSGETENIGPVSWTALFLMLLLGIAGGLVMGLLAPWLVNDALKIPPQLRVETLNSFYLLAFSIPVVISTAALRGVLEAYQRFDIASIIRLPLGLLMFAGPLLVLPFSKSLVPVVGVLLAGRILAWIAHFVSCLVIVPVLKQNIQVRAALIMPLFRFGGWMSISNLVSPLMVYMDRFLIGAVLSMAAVTYYTTPYEIVTKTLLLPAALTGVLFPAFASSLARNKIQAIGLYKRGVNYIIFLMFPLILIAITFAPEGLSIWLGDEFSLKSFKILQWLAAGVFFNSVAQVSFSLIQAAGRPDITAKLHAAELPLYLISLWCLLSLYGVEGVAIAWLLRVFVDMVALFFLTHRVIPAKNSHAAFATYLAIATAFFLFGAALHNETLKVLYVLFALITFLGMAWLVALSSAERDFIRSRLSL